MSRMLPKHSMSDPRRRRRAIIPALVIPALLLAMTQSVGAAPPETRFGTTVYKNPGETTREAFHRVRGKYGGELGAVRVFYPGMPASWNKIRANYGSTPLVVSFAPNPAAVLSGKHDAAFRTWFAGAPSGRDIWWSYWHEPENDAPRAFSHRAYRKAWRHIERIADRADVGPRVDATLILMCWTLAKNSGRNWRDYYAGDDVVDVLGFDCYNGGHKKGRYRPVEDFLGPAAALARRVGKPWGVAELGSLVVRGDNGSGRAGWLRSYAKFARDHGARFVTYWDSKKNHDYRLHDRPSRSAWRTAVEDSVN